MLSVKPKWEIRDLGDNQGSVKAGGDVGRGKMW